MKLEDGIHDIGIREYHESEGVSRSSLMALQRSPYHFWYENISGQATPRVATPAMDMGELVHTLCLEPHLTEERFAVMPKVDRRTKAGKETWSIFESALGAATPIKLEDFEKAQDMAASFRSNGVASALILGAKFEKSIYFTHEPTGLQCKVRPDIWAGNIIGDLKTTKDANIYSFQGSAKAYGYYLQAGMINEALKSIGQDMERFIFLPVEKEEPYAAAAYPLSAEALEYGIKQFDELMFKLKECYELGRWPGYEIQELELPAYLRSES